MVSTSASRVWVWLCIVAHSRDIGTLVKVEISCNWLCIEIVDWFGIVTLCTLHGEVSTMSFDVSVDVQKGHQTKESTESSREAGKHDGELISFV
ncbi:hypothetical protein DFH29DRAFT_895713 [Suillus ampliporus]|nr:hypothetical protein DFH29DRAFT_895713 [Suillus ampliporus]